MLKIFATSTNPTCKEPKSLFFSHLPRTNHRFTIGDMAAGGYWSVIEIDVGIFCLCLPSVRSLLSRLFPRVFGSTKEASSMGHPSSQKKLRSHDRNTSFVQLIEMDNSTGQLKSHPDH